MRKQKIEQLIKRKPVVMAASPACDDDKCYMITDKELAERFKRTVRE